VKPPGREEEGALLEVAGDGAGEAEATGRVLVLMRPGTNRSLVLKQLSSICDASVPTGDSLAPDSFDLAITDLAGLKEWWTPLLEAKYKAEPTFLPVALIVSRSDLKQRVRALWDIVDEFIVSPIDQREFVERVTLLLRTRRLAIEQRNRLAYVVNHDRVTGLPNKNLFMLRVNDAVRDAAVLSRPLHVSVLHVPLSRVLKSFGNAGTDGIAARVSARLTALVGEEVYIARLTTEEWGLVHRASAPLQDVLTALTKVLTLGEDPFEVEGERIYLTPRVGVSVYPTDGTTATALLDSALAALDTAQPSEPAFYSRDLQHTALRIIRTEARLREAVEKNQLELWFQPQVELRGRGVIGVEALVRWRLPTGELVPPDRFLPVAEETGIIGLIDDWVLREACAAMRRWRDEGLELGWVSVNVCASDLRDEGFVRRVQDALASAGLAPEDLELELTETDLIEAGDVNVAKLVQLRDEGVRIAIDDFGTGYSSLAYLSLLPITTLKIDRAFVNDVATNEKDAAITEVIVGLADRFGLVTIAEGVETERQAASLSSMGVHIAQGYLYGKPMPDPELRTWLGERLRRRRSRAQRGAPGA